MLARHPIHKKGGENMNERDLRTLTALATLLGTAAWAVTMTRKATR